MKIEPSKYGCRCWVIKGNEIENCGRPELKGFDLCERHLTKSQQADAVRLGVITWSELSKVPNER